MRGVLQRWLLPRNGILSSSNTVYRQPKIATKNLTTTVSWRSLGSSRMTDNWQRYAGHRSNVPVLEPLVASPQWSSRTPDMRKEIIASCNQDFSQLSFSTAQGAAACVRDSESLVHKEDTEADTVEETNNRKGRSEQQIERTKRVGSEAQNFSALAGISELNLLGPVVPIVKFAVEFVFNCKDFAVFTVRTLFQCARPLIAFCLLGEVMKLAVVSISTSSIAFMFSMLLGFEVFYFFLQCFISYTFLSMFFGSLF
eukprot:Selendium_serpulae@DN5973_c0_g2_i1.p1